MSFEWLSCAVLAVAWICAGNAGAAAAFVAAMFVITRIDRIKKP